MYFWSTERDTLELKELYDWSSMQGQTEISSANESKPLFETYQIKKLQFIVSQKKKV